jgi:uncharacterized membrane protein
MGTVTIKPDTRFIDLPGINRVEASRPFQWLKKGAADLGYCWLRSLAVGALFTLIGWGLINYAWPRPHLVLTLLSGFLLISPFLALSFYEQSRRREAGGGPWFASARGNWGSIGLFAAGLAFILSSWERVSAILVALFHPVTSWANSSPWPAYSPGQTPLSSPCTPSPAVRSRCWCSPCRWSPCP